MGSRLVRIGRTLPDAPPASSTPDWVAASPARIERSLARALARPSGGWFVLGPSDSVGARPSRYVVAGEELVAWRDGDVLRVAPATCPHMGADLSAGRVVGGRLVCPWHGLSLGPEGHGRWRCYPAHDDGVLAWAQLAEAGQSETDAPILAPRPGRPFLYGVMTMEARCDPEDVIANRLDPWHGAHYHPHSFASLAVTDVGDDSIALRVAYRVAGPLCVEVDATFHSPEPRTITMTIVGGEGVGSVVETHATPIAPGRCLVVEATIATSDRRGFAVALAARRLFRGMIERRAARLWVEDTAYAERRYVVRTRQGGSLVGAARLRVV